MLRYQDQPPGDQRPAGSLRDVRDLCRVYGVTDQAQVDEFMSPTSQAREPGWWTKYHDVLPLHRLGAGGRRYHASLMYYVPALLQTGDYARATVKSIERKMGPAVLDQRAEARLRRQQLLDQETRRDTGRCLTRPSCTGKSVARRSCGTAGQGP